MSSRIRDNAQEGAVKVIDPKRANNGGIILARLRKSHDEIAKGIDAVDELILSVQQTTSMIEFIPTREERKALGAYLDSGQDPSILCECEKFMVSMMKVQKPKEKMEAMLFKYQFPSMVEDLGSTITILSNACKEILASSRLPKLFAVILKVGNRLNRAGNRSIKTEAGGFAIESLHELTEVKAWDKKTTLLMYLARIARRWNESLLHLNDELPHVLKTLDWQITMDYDSSLSSLEKQLLEVRSTALSLPNSNSDNGSCASEECLLQESSLGRFVLQASDTLDQLRIENDELEITFKCVLQYLAQKEDINAVDLCKSIASFCSNLNVIYSKSMGK
eukprot:283648_1